MQDFTIYLYLHQMPLQNHLKSPYELIVEANRTAQEHVEFYRYPGNAGMIRSLLRKCEISYVPGDELDRLSRDVPSVLRDAYRFLLEAVFSGVEKTRFHIDTVDLREPYTDISVIREKSTLCTVATFALQEANPGLDVVADIQPILANGPGEIDVVEFGKDIGILFKFA